MPRFRETQMSMELPRAPELGADKFASQQFEFTFMWDTQGRRMLKIAHVIGGHTEAAAMLVDVTPLWRAKPE